MREKHSVLQRERTVSGVSFLPQRVSINKKSISRPYVLIYKDPESLLLKCVWVYGCLTGSVWLERSPAGKGKSELLTQLVPARGNWDSGYHVLQGFYLPLSNKTLHRGTEERPLTQTLSLSLDTLYMLNMANKPLWSAIKVLRPYQRGRDRENVRASERKIERVGSNCREGGVALEVHSAVIVVQMWRTTLPFSLADGVLFCFVLGFFSVREEHCSQKCGICQTWI